MSFKLLALTKAEDIRRAETHKNFHCLLFKKDLTKMYGHLHFVDFAILIIYLNSIAL